MSTLKSPKTRLPKTGNRFGLGWDEGWPQSPGQRRNGSRAAWRNECGASELQWQNGNADVQIEPHTIRKKSEYTCILSQNMYIHIIYLLPILYIHRHIVYIYDVYYVIYTRIFAYRSDHTSGA